MSIKRILVILGTRPEAIKMASVIQALRQSPHAEVHVCSTGQHREMLQQVLTLFGIQPDYDLDVMRPNQSPIEVAARVMLKLTPLLERLRPDWVLVQGDTTTVLAAAIAAYYGKVRVGHVEAGLRTYDRLNPFPEEMNRVVTDHISDIHFAPTSTALTNLLQEGISKEQVYVTGNTVIDSLLQIADRPLPDEVRQWLDSQELGWVVGHGKPVAKRLILVTAHRRENHGEPLNQICAALKQIVQDYPETHIVYPVHRNPNVWEPVHKLLHDVPGISLVPPLDYVTLVYLMKQSTLILTDSGGIQEEAPSLGVPVLILRETTERREAVDAGVNRLVGTDMTKIMDGVRLLLTDVSVYDAMAQAVNPYGDGIAGKRIADVIIEGTCQEFVPESTVIT